MIEIRGSMLHGVLGFEITLQERAGKACHLWAASGTPKDMAPLRLLNHLTTAVFGEKHRATPSRGKPHRWLMICSRISASLREFPTATN